MLNKLFFSHWVMQKRYSVFHFYKNLLGYKIYKSFSSQYSIFAFTQFFFWGGEINDNGTVIGLGFYVCCHLRSYFKRNDLQSLKRIFFYVNQKGIN